MCFHQRRQSSYFFFKFFSTNLSFLAKLWGPFSLLYSDWRFAPDLDSLHEVGFTFIALLSPIETCIKMHQFIMCQNYQKHALFVPFMIPLEQPTQILRRYSRKLTSTAQSDSPDNQQYRSIQKNYWEPQLIYTLYKNNLY